LILGLNIIKGVDIVARKEVKGPITDNALNNINHNFIELYNEFVSAGMNAQEALNKVNQMVGIADNALKVAKQSDSKSDDTQQQLDDIILKDGNDIAEVVQARGGEPLLKDRLNKTDSQLSDVKNLENYELTSKGRKKKGYVIFVSDDAHRGDWEVLKPMFESKGVPFCTAVVTDWMQPDHPNNGSRMTWEQLEYLQNEMGCEIMSHYTSHNDPRPTEHSDADLDVNLKESRDILIEKGFNCQTFRVPGNNMEVRERNAIRKYYRANIVSDAGDTGLNLQPYETFELKSIWIDNESYGGAKEFSYYKEHIDRANEQGAILIISMHGYALDGVENVLEETLDYAISNSNVTTLREALNKSGNIVEIGDYTRTRRNDRAPGNFYAVSSDGIVAGGMFMSKPDAFGLTNKWYDYPHGTTICAISGNHPELNSFPEGSAGVFTSVKPSNFGAYFYQQYRPRRSNKTYYRVLDTNEELTDWFLESPHISFNFEEGQDLNFNHGIKDYNLGITYNEVRSYNSDLGDAPEGRPGVRITQKTVLEDNAQSYNSQIYIINSEKEPNIYIRRASSLSEWGKWSRVTGQSRVDNVNVDLSSGLVDFELGQTMTLISSDSPTVNNAPEGEPGILITYNVTGGNPLGANHQEYHLNYKFSRLSIYKRRPTSEGGWSDWVLVSVK